MYFFKTGTEHGQKNESVIALSGQGFLTCASFDIFCCAELVKLDEWRREYGAAKFNLDSCSAVVFGREGAMVHDFMTTFIPYSCAVSGAVRDHKYKHITHLCKTFISDHRQGINSTAVFCKKNYNRESNLIGL